MNKKTKSSKSLKGSGTRNVARKQMTEEAIRLIAAQMRENICDEIMGECALEVDEIRLRDALIKELTENSTWGKQESNGSAFLIKGDSDDRNWNKVTVSDMAGGLVEHLKGELRGLGYTVRDDATPITGVALIEQ